MSLTNFFALPAAWFTVPAMVGTLVFFLKLLFMAIGGHGAGHDADGGGAHAASDAQDAHGHDTSKGNQGFKVLSIQVIAASLMGFGWAGYGSLVGSMWPMLAHVAVGMGAGFLCAGTMVWLLGLLGKMKADGTLRHESLLGVEGDVYISVPLRGQGMGRVRIVVDNRERFVNAVSDSTPIPTKGRVLVVGTNPDNSFSVMPLDAAAVAPISAGARTLEPPPAPAQVE